MEEKKYPTRWIDMDLGNGSTLSVAVCSYCNKVRHLTTSPNDMRKTMIVSATVVDSNCSSGDHCLAFDCPLNKTDQHHVLHMLDMTEDKELDEAAATRWDCKTMSEFYIKLAKEISDKYLE